MWLRYGVSEDNKLIAIEEVASGKTDLICPYCGSSLIAKKGSVKEHHFAHVNHTCYPVIKREPRELPTLPLYDAFDIFLSGKELERLEKLWHRHKSHNNGINRLEVLPTFTRKKLLEYNQALNTLDSYGAYQFTDLGKIPVKALALPDFNTVQESLILQKLAQLEAAMFDNKGVVLSNPELSFRLTDLRIYTAQVRKILLSTLYYLQVEADGQLLHKIGITTRPIAKRLTEIEYDLRAHYKKATVKVLGTWGSRGNVEKYFKYKYSDFNYRIGSLTEYFQFNNSEDAIAVKRDLEQMEPKALSQTEQEIFEIEASSIEEILCSQLTYQERSLPTPAQEVEQHLDRLTQAALVRFFLSRPSSGQIIDALHQGSSVQQAAQIASIPVDVARKVLAVMQQQAIASAGSANF